jgi:hypothetical protein
MRVKVPPVHTNTKEGEVKKIIALVLMSAALVACSDSKAAKKALDDQGYTHVSTQGRPGFLFWFSGCADDTFATGFTAKNINGKTIEGVVCNGWFKGATVRTF